MKNELLKGLSEEQAAKVKACKSAEEILALAKAEGIELTDEQLEAASGGAGSCLHPDEEPQDKCPACGSNDVKLIGQQYLVCNKCLHRWTPAITVNR